MCICDKVYDRTNKLPSASLYKISGSAHLRTQRGGGQYCTTCFTNIGPIFMANIGPVMLACQQGYFTRLPLLVMFSEVRFNLTKNTVLLSGFNVI